MTSLIAVAFLVLTAAALVVFYQLMKAPTQLGQKVRDELEGFRRYLSVAEADRLNAQHPPRKTPELFEAYLPYALALDVGQEWAEQFDEVLRAAGRTDAHGGYRSSWYSGRALGAAALAGALGADMASAISSSSRAPGSSSGRGGGGSSGGGGGGGGGGGW